MTHNVNACRTSILCLVTLVVVLPLAACGGDDAEVRPSLQPRLPIEVSAAGFTITLTEAMLTYSDIQLVFLIQDDVPGEGPELVLLEPPTPGDITLDGLAWRGQFGGEMKPILDPASTAQPRPLVGYQMSMRLGLAADASKPVSISFAGLPFSAAVMGERGDRVEGPWRFAFTPRDIALDRGKV